MEMDKSIMKVRVHNLNNSPKINTSQSGGQIEFHPSVENNTIVGKIIAVY